MFLFAFTFSQVSVLGLWSVFSPTAWWKRLSGLLIGTASLEATFDFGSRGEFVFMPSAAMALTVVSLLVARWFGVRLIRQADGVHSRRPEPRGFRFSIRGLMALTAVVALLGGWVRAVQESRGQLSFVVTVMWASCIVPVGLLAIRAVLGIVHPIRRGILTVAVSPILGAFFAHAVVENEWDGWVYVITIMLFYPAVLLGSLLVVRSCGHRLVSRRVLVKGGRMEPASEAVLGPTVSAGSSVEGPSGPSSPGATGPSRP